MNGRRERMLKRCPLRLVLLCSSSPSPSSFASASIPRNPCHALLPLPFTQLTSPPMEPPRPGGEGGHVIRVTGTARNRATVFCHSRCVRPISRTDFSSHRLVRAGTRAAKCPRDIRRISPFSSLFLPLSSRDRERERASALGTRVSPGRLPPLPLSPIPPSSPPPSFCICILPRFCFPSLPPSPLLAAPAAAGEERALPATTICRVAMRPRDLVYWEYGK